MINKKISLYLKLLFFYLLVLFSGCQNTTQTSNEKKLKVMMAGSEENIMLMDSVIKRFNQNFPEVKVEPVFIASASNWATYVNKIISSVAIGKGPDVFFAAIQGAEFAASKGVLFPLDSLIINDPRAEELLQDIAKPLIDAFVYDGLTYYFPESWNNMVIYYNTKLFDEAGVSYPKEDWTWEDFLETAKALTKRDEDGNVEVWGYQLGLGSFSMSPWMLTNNTRILTKDWKHSNLNDPLVKEVFQFIYDLVYVHKVSPIPDFTRNSPPLFSNSRAAMTSCGHWCIFYYYDNNLYDFDVQYWPRNKSMKTNFGVGGWGISSKSNNKQLAWEFILELVSKESMAQMAGFGNAIPARESTANLPIFLKHPKNSKIFYESIYASEPTPSPKSQVKFESIFNRYQALIMTGTMPIEEALNEAHQSLELIFERDLMKENLLKKNKKN